MNQLLGIDNVFTPDLCCDLIDGFKEHGGETTGFMRDINGESVKVLDSNLKIRQDWFIDEDDPLIPRIAEAIGEHIATRITQPFAVERFMVARYDVGGHFKPHCDNTEKATARRWLACSINLNDDYEGGGLNFPELGMKASPPIGSAIIFHCSVLHEVTPIIRGQRFVFPTFFLYG